MLSHNCPCVVNFNRTFWTCMLHWLYKCPLFVAQTPIEEFTPTPAFPALQYLESVDEGGVAWRAGLRMGDFLIEVSAEHHGTYILSFPFYNYLKSLKNCPHYSRSHFPFLYLSVYCFYLFSRWMVRMWLRWDTGRWSIWSGKAATASWSRLSWLPETLIWRKGSERKVRDTNSHSRYNSEVLHDDYHWTPVTLFLSLFLHTVPQQSKRLSTPAIALRSKSMTSELEEMGKMWEMRGQKNGGRGGECSASQPFLTPTAPSLRLNCPLISTNQKCFIWIHIMLDMIYSDHSIKWQRNLPLSGVSM